MTWLWPIGLVALIALPLIFVLHALRPRHRELPVSSLLLWRDASVSPRSRRRWRRPRLTLLLLLQLAAAALVAFAIARPAAEKERERHLAIVIDGSRVMQAVDIAPSRFAAARAEASDALRGLGPADAATIVIAGAEPETIVQAADPATAWAALNGPAAGRRVRPGDTAGDLAAAIEVAGAAVRSVPARSNDLLLLSGTSLDAIRLADVPARITVKTFGSGGPNTGLVAFDVRQLPGAAAARAYARVVNYGDMPTTLTLSLSGDGVVLERRTVRLGARGEQPLTFAVPPGVRAVDARLEPPGEGADLLPADDRAEAAVGGVLRDVTFVGATTDPVYRALNVLPGVAVRQVTPDKYRQAESQVPSPKPQDESSDPRSAARGPRSVLVFSGWLPNRPPAGPALIVAPPFGSTWLTVGQQTAAGRLVRQDEQSPLLRGVDLSNVNFGPIRPADRPAWAASSVDAAEGPIVYQGVLGGHRVAVLAFDPSRSNLPKQPFFPLLLVNSLDWLTPAAGPGSVSANAAVGAGEGDLRAPAAPPIPAPIELPDPGRLVDATWWQWLVLAAFLVLLGEWWRYGREAR